MGARERRATFGGNCDEHAANVSGLGSGLVSLLCRFVGACDFPGRSYSRFSPRGFLSSFLFDFQFRRGFGSIYTFCRQLWVMRVGFLGRISPKVMFSDPFDNFFTHSCLKLSAFLTNLGKFQIFNRKISFPKDFLSIFGKKKTFLSIFDRKKIIVRPNRLHLGAKSCVEAQKVE